MLNDKYLEILIEHKELLTLLCGFLVIAISANQIAKVFQRYRFPLITGLIFGGIIAGPYVLELIPKGVSANLRFINEVSLAYIAFAAGAELYLVELRSKLRAIKINAAVQSFVGLAFGTAILFLCIDFVPFASSFNTTSKVVFSLLTAVLFIAPSPASVIAVISELRAKGPFTKTVLGVTMAKDFLVVVLFAVTLSVSKSLLGSRDISIADYLVLFLELLASFGLAYLIGILLFAILKWGQRKYLKTTLILVLGFAVYAFSNFFRSFSAETLAHEVYLEPLLICLIASFYVVNYTKYRAEFLRILNDVSHYIYVVFFTLTGASMDIPVLAEVWTLMLLFFVIRLITIVLGTSLSSAIMKEKLIHYKVGWMPFIAQAGVALGLVTVVADQFPSWGQDFATLGISVIIINQLIGPPLIAKALTLMGEDRSRAPVPEFDGIRDAIIVGYESQSVALAKQLMENGWEVQIATAQKEGSFEEPEGIIIRYFADFSYEEFISIEANKTEAIVLMLSDQENLEIAEMIYHRIGTKDIIVRLNHRYNSQKFLALNALIVDPSTAIVSLLDHFVRSPQAASLLLGMEKGQDTRDIELLNPDLHGITLRDLRLPADLIILSVVRGGQTIITHGYTRLRMRDIVTVVGSIKSLNEMELKFDR